MSEDARPPAPADQVSTDEGSGPTSRDPTEGADLARRRFFRQFSRDALNAAATVAGAAGAIRRGSLTASTEVLGLGLGDPETNARRLEALSAARTRLEPSAEFRSSYRFTGDALHLLDQRSLPQELAEIECRTSSDVVNAIRGLVVRGGPVLAQIAAYGLVLAAHGSRLSPPPARAAMLRGGAAALKRARPEVAAIHWAVDRLLRRWASVGELAEGDVVVDALRAEADAIATEAMMDQARLGRWGAELLAQPPDRPLQVLLHGDTGPLSGGLVGTAMAVATTVASDGRPVHIWLTEARPSGEGARLAAWELRHADVPFTLIADSAAGWLLGHEPVDAVLVGADWVAANGDLSGLIGSYSLAALAARHELPFYACAVLAAVDRHTPSGAAIPLEERPAAELLGVASPGAGTAPAPDARNPASDLVPADLVTALVTDEGVLHPPYAEALATALDASEERRPPLPEAVV